MCIRDSPYTDPEIEIDIELGIPKSRSNWLKTRKKESTQMSLAREGFITEEMEYIAIRENQNLESNSQLKEGQFHKAKTLALIFQNFIPQNLLEMK